MQINNFKTLRKKNAIVPLNHFTFVLKLPEIKLLDLYSITFKYALGCFEKKSTTLTDPFFES